VKTKPVEQAEKTKSGIYIPEKSEKERPEEGEVVAVGDGFYQDGKLIPLRIKVGDKVVFSKYSYDEIKIEGKEYVIVKEENILAVIN
jgi:chaperonin GroES